MRTLRKWVNSRLGALLGVTAGLLFLAAVAAGQAVEAQGKPETKPAPGQQLCPATPGAATCQVTIECPPIQAPGKTTCQATIDCPPPVPDKAWNKAK